MGQQMKPANVFSAMHHRVTGELLHLMDGLYSNIEDGLFELAFRTRREDQKRRCFDLMRDMRFQRSRVVQTFARRLQGVFDAWVAGNPADQDADARAMRMAQKSRQHFSGVLQCLTERTSYALGNTQDQTALPMGPYQISCSFVEALKSLEFDDDAIGIVEELFSRFVLERMGSVYGECNQRLENAGFLTLEEATELEAQAG